ncbi:hypothetical protein [Micromonospora sp. WMMD1274]|uniref:hypothetical protein n=1 Tax=Micromonospora sp. WMMD1274 TaxID=3404116 RepID=UPI003B92A21E
MNREQDEIQLVTETKKSFLEAAKEAAEAGLHESALDFATGYAILHYGKLPGEAPASKS